MQKDDLIFVSVDDHVLEPADMFEGRMPAKFADDGPRFVADKTGQGEWIVGDVTSPWAMKYEAMRPGAWQADKRVEELSSVGILGSLCFPSFPRFAGQLFSQVSDKELALASIRAYNDWMVEEWAGAHPDRLIPIAVMPLWDPELMGEEVRRMAKKGTHVVAFSENPYKLGYPSIYDAEHWKPFWTACSDEGSVIATHIGSSSNLPETSPDCGQQTRGVLIPMNLYGTAADFVWSGVFQTYSPLKLLLAEGGIGWVPFFMERCDMNYKARPWIREQYGPKPPSEVFKEHAITCFIDDDCGVEMRDRIGTDIICWEFDYPHGDCLWPDGVEFAWETYLKDMPEDDVNKMTHLNAMRELQFDPFSTRGRENCTVGALRAGSPTPHKGAVNGGFWDSALGKEEAEWRAGVTDSAPDKVDAAG